MLHVEWHVMVGSAGHGYVVHHPVCQRLFTKSSSSYVPSVTDDMEHLAVSRSLFHFLSLPTKFNRVKNLQCDFGQKPQV